MISLSRMVESLCFRLCLVRVDGISSIVQGIIHISTTSHSYRCWLRSATSSSLSASPGEDDRILAVLGMAPKSGVRRRLGLEASSFVSLMLRHQAPEAAHNQVGTAEARRADSRRSASRGRGLVCTALGTRARRAKRRGIGEDR